MTVALTVWDIDFSTLTTVAEFNFWQGELERILAETKQKIADYEAEGVNPDWLNREKQARKGLGYRITRLAKHRRRFNEAHGLTRTRPR
jgi:hypothetical protein